MKFQKLYRRIVNSFQRHRVSTNPSVGQYVLLQDDKNSRSPTPTPCPPESKDNIAARREALVLAGFESFVPSIHEPHPSKRRIPVPGDLDNMRRISEMRKPNSDYMEIDFGGSKLDRRRENAAPVKKSSWLYDLSEELVEVVLRRAGFKNKSWLINRNGDKFILYVVNKKKIVKTSITRFFYNPIMLWQINSSKSFRNLPELIDYYKEVPLPGLLITLGQPVYFTVG